MTASAPKAEPALRRLRTSLLMLPVIVLLLWCIAYGLKMERPWGFVLAGVVAHVAASLSPPRRFYYVVSAGIAAQVVGLLVHLRVLFILGAAVTLLGGIYCLVFRGRDSQPAAQ